jgi:short-subunit dehydrogenase
MTRFLGPDLKARNSEKTKSAIINLTSSYSDWPAFNLPIYSAGKNFSDVFSQNLWYEN